MTLELLLKVVNNMKKYIKLSILLAVTSSLQLNCAFNVAKKIGKTVCAIPLTALTVDFARMNSNEKECVAKHEAGHTVIQAQRAQIMSVKINKGLMNKGLMNSYTGLTHCRMNIQSLDNLQYIITASLAGPAQDLHNKNWLERQNFMELELGLPLTRTQKSLSNDLEYIHEKGQYKGDLQGAYQWAYKIAEHEILNDINLESNPIIQKQIEDRVQDLLLQGLQQAKTLVKQNQPQINAVAQALYDKEYLSGDEVRAIIESCK